MESLIVLKDRLELFLLSHPRAIIQDFRTGTWSLTDSRISLEIEFGKLLLTLWTGERSMLRRISGVKEWSEDSVILMVRDGSHKERELYIDADHVAAARPQLRAARRQFAHKLACLLQARFPGLLVEKLLTSKNLAQSFSEHYARGVALMRSSRWGLFGVNRSESPATVDAMLSYALIWLNYLQAQSARARLDGMVLVVPKDSGIFLTPRMGLIRSPGIHIELLEADDEMENLDTACSKDYGNLESRLSKVDRVPLPAEEIPWDALPPCLKRAESEIEIVHRAASRFFSIRYHGLEFARLTEERVPKISYGVSPIESSYDRSKEPELERLWKELQQFRRPDCPDPHHPYFRLQAERWLESLVLRDIRKISNDLNPAFVYPQVPAFSGLDRAVIDILSVTRSHRLAVIELKISEDIQLPLQALDYWRRVKWHFERGDFERQGYFPNLSLSSEDPVLFLVCPAFRFHSTTEGILKYFPKSLEITKVGINEGWRNELKVLYRKHV
ncbi:MAG: hypothetical protein PHX83_00985 [Acidobacteriia bacterium]|nr:hypothetical protein [Terriglobia bacterium]